MKRFLLEEKDFDSDRANIILNKDTEIASGDGTISNPYVIS